MHIAYLSLGTNLGDKLTNINHAEHFIEINIGKILSRSNIYITKPWGYTSPNDFLNSVIKISTELKPQELLENTQNIERIMGRIIKSVDGKYHDRIIDIDILLYDDLTICDKNLHIPHPLMFKRDFVMKPLNEIIDAKEAIFLKQIQAKCSY